MPHRAVEVLRSLSHAKADRDYARAAALRREAATIAHELQIPLLTPAYVRIPNLTSEQKPYFARIVTRLLRKVPCTSWERQALRARIFLVRTIPHTVRSTFEHHANKVERLVTTPHFYCGSTHKHLWDTAGAVCILQGHFALMPVCLSFNGHQLRSKDPVPIRVLYREG